jgi:signal transduction histidine kinase
MRSLAARLTLAFLFVGLLGAVLVAAIVGWRTRQDFDRFVSDQDRYSAVAVLGQYYQANGSWAGVESFFNRPGPGGYRRWAERLPPMALVDQDGQVVWSGGQYQAGEQISQGELNRSVPIQVEDVVVGRVLLEVPTRQPIPGSPEAVFVSRLTLAVIFSAIGATAIALLLGALLARTISRPVQALTEATQEIAQGKLGLQVEVSTDDELGELAGSFNRMSADLARANELRRQMTADIAHDLRTPLSVILGYTEALAEGKLPGTEESFSVMHKEAQRLQRLIDDLRTLSLADSGELTLTRQWISPAEILRRAAAAHRARAQDQDIEIRVEVEPNLPNLHVDPDRMAQVLDNLLTNALRYTPAGGRITLAAEAGPSVQEIGGNQAVVLHVRDTGGGIPPEDMPHIFDRFFRGDLARHEEGESGLGLAIARSLLQAQGGTISVASTPGSGTTFTLTLPAEDR